MITDDYRQSRRSRTAPAPQSRSRAPLGGSQQTINRLFVGDRLSEKSSDFKVEQTLQTIQTFAPCAPM